MVLSGVLPPPLLTHSSDLLEEFARILKPSGAVLLAELVITSEESEYVGGAQNVLVELG